jgi:DNA-damage-inducible protein D
MDQSNHSLFVPTNLSFESLKKLNQHGVEYWSARDLQPCLGYANWRDFKNAIKKALKSCEQAGNIPDHHFAHVRKQIEFGTNDQCWYG